ncbi:MAG: DUF3841 domain-containing protein [Lachnospiraceae bacterium]|nr:DUF3841 domain-containing protein [Lachnospiraceae bacterium]
MAEITVWTMQNEAVLEQLDQNGRFIAEERYMRQSMEDTSDIMLFVYRWLASHMPTVSVKPPDVKYPVWVALNKETSFKAVDGCVTLELLVDEALMARADITKWTNIINYSYIPLSDADKEAHYKLLTDYGIDDVKAVTTPFYPQIRRKIIDSWDRLFDDSVSLGGAGAYGLLWEVKQEWVRKVTR